jgi:hypothetical protein
MDNAAFDRFTRELGRKPTRRGVLGMALAAAVAALPVARPAKAQIGVPGGMCGGIAGIPCPPGYTCVDNPGDGCNPDAGGADCSGICVPYDYNPCAAMLCVEGTTCCPNCGGICVPVGTPCSDELCQFEMCNQVVCGPGEYCCNASCSRCAPIGQGCTRELCGPPTGERCGSNTCAPDEYARRSVDSARSSTAGQKRVGCPVAARFAQLGRSAAMKVVASARRLMALVLPCSALSNRR